MIARSSFLFTSEVFARRFLQLDFDALLVEWAEAMVLAGFDGDGLCSLLGEQAPFNGIEIEHLLDGIGKDLFAPEIGSRSEAVVIIATAHIRRMSRGTVDAVSALADVTRLYIDVEDDDAIYPFYQLHYAYADLALEEVQFHWPGATQKNIDEIIAEICAQWLAQNDLTPWSALENWP